MSPSPPPLQAGEQDGSPACPCSWEVELPPQAANTICDISIAESAGDNQELLESTLRVAQLVVVLPEERCHGGDRTHTPQQRGKHLSLETNGLQLAAARPDDAFDAHDAP